MIYIAIFCVTTIFVYFSEFLFKNNQKSLSYIVVAFTIIFISIFAGIRDTTVGTDVEYYVVKHFNWGKNFSGHPLDYLGFMYYDEEVDPLYSIIVFIGANIFDNINFILFVLSFIVNFFVYLAIANERGKISVSIGWMIYCLLFFNTSLNIVRQACAVSIVFYLSVLLTNKKLSLRKFILLGISAVLLHRSCIIILCCLPILHFLSLTQKRKYLLCISCVFVCSLPLGFEVLSSVVSSFSFLPAKYSLYFNSLNSEQSKLLLEFIICSLPTFVLTVVIFKKKYFESSIRFYYVLAIVSISQFLSTNLIISRISYYLVIFFIISVPYSAQLISSRSRGRLVYHLFIIIWFSIMWYINIIKFGYGETFPYRIAL